MSSLSLSWSAQPTMLGQALNRLRDACPPTTDVTLLVDSGRPVKAHRAVLAAFSLLFERALRDFGQYSGELLVLVPSVQQKHVQLLLKYMYEGSVDIPEEDFAELSRVAEMLKIQMLGLTNTADSNRSKTTNNEEEGGNAVEAQNSQGITSLPEQSCLGNEVTQKRIRRGESGSKQLSKSQVPIKRLKVQKRQTEYRKKMGNLHYQKYQRQRPPHQKMLNSTPHQPNLHSEHLSENQTSQVRLGQSWENQLVVVREQQPSPTQEHRLTQSQEERPLNVLDHRHMQVLDPVVTIDQQAQLETPSQEETLEQHPELQLSRQHLPPLQTCGQVPIHTPVHQQMQPPVQQDDVHQCDREVQTDSHCEVIKVEDDEVICDGSVPPAQHPTHHHTSNVNQTSPIIFPSSSRHANSSSTSRSNSSHSVNPSTSLPCAIGLSNKKVPGNISAAERLNTPVLTPITSTIQSSDNQLPIAPTGSSSQRHSSFHGNEPVNSPSHVLSSHIPSSSQVPSSSLTQFVASSSRAYTSSETSSHSYEQSPSHGVSSSSQRLSLSTSTTPPSNDVRLTAAEPVTSIVASSVGKISLSKQATSSDVSLKTFAKPFPPTAPIPSRQDRKQMNVSRPGTPFPRSSFTNRSIDQENAENVPVSLPAWCEDVINLESEDEFIEDSGDSDIDSLCIDDKEELLESATMSKSRPPSPDGAGLSVSMATWNSYEKDAVNNGLVANFQATLFSNCTNRLPPSVTDLRSTVATSVVSSEALSNGSQSEVQEKEESSITNGQEPCAPLGRVLNNFWQRGVRNGDNLNFPLDDVRIGLQHPPPEEQGALPSQQLRIRGRGRGRGRARGRGMMRGRKTSTTHGGSLRVKLRHLESVRSRHRLCSPRAPNEWVPQNRQRSLLLRGVKRTRRGVGRPAMRGRGQCIQKGVKKTANLRVQRTSCRKRRVNAATADAHQETAIQEAEATSLNPPQQDESRPDAMMEINSETEPVRRATAESHDTASSANPPSKARRNLYFCNFCGEGFRYKASLALHKKHHELNVCRLCDSGFQTHSELSRHMLWHQKVIKNSLRSNMSNTDNAGGQNNNEEGETQDSSPSTSIQGNRRNGSPGKLFSCLSCQATFSRRVDLRQHSRQCTN